MNTYIKTTAVILLASLTLGGLTSCFKPSKFDTNKFYSEIKDDAITDKDDIEYRDKGVFMKTCAGFVNALDDRDARGIEKLCSDKLLSMDGTEDMIEEMIDGFEGDVIDTSVLPTDLSANTYSQWSKTDPIDYFDADFFIYTDEQTYWVTLSLYSIIGDDDLIGLNRIRILTIDKRFNMEVTVPEGLEEGEGVNLYLFEDGTTAEMVYEDSCGMLVCYGDSSDFIAVNIGVGTAYEVFRLTGGGDEIDRDDIDDVDWKDEEEALEFLEDYEPYAVGRDSAVEGYYSQARFYLIDGADEMLYVNINGDGVPEKVIFAEIFDPTETFSKDKAEVLHSSKDNKDS